MGTNNFHYRNTDRLYAVEDHEDILDDVRSNFLLHMMKGVEKIKWDDRYCDPEELRSYPSHHVGEIRMSDVVFDFDIGVAVHIVLRGGYYEGACFDYNLEYWHNYSSSEEDLEDILVEDDLSQWFDLSPKMSARVAAAMRRRFEKMEARILKQMYAFLKANSTQYRKVATACNGETFYEKTEE